MGSMRSTIARTADAQPRGSAGPWSAWCSAGSRRSSSRRRTVEAVDDLPERRCCALDGLGDVLGRVLKHDRDARISGDRRARREVPFRLSARLSATSELAEDFGAELPNGGRRSGVRR
jgi:hypothetical protein